MYYFPKLEVNKIITITIYVKLVETSLPVRSQMRELCDDECVHVVLGL
jgi:hypothetical protein